VLAGDPPAEEGAQLPAPHPPVAPDLPRAAPAVRNHPAPERAPRRGADNPEPGARAAQRAAHPHPANPPPTTRTTPPAPHPRTDLTTAMVRQSLDAFVNLDTRQARVVCRLGDEVDRYNAAIIEELIRVMRGSPEMVEPGLSLFSATRHLERIADHATNIAEDVVYLVEGEIIRHRPAAVDVDE